ncbi:hypothetical protein DL770_003552 [Monosporascus sp. CRB-9-2]|nr:hypothetical protein DL770_003552 [Monosporascus sp. CRB-9-2]
MDNSDNHRPAAAVQHGRFPFALAHLLTVSGLPLGGYDSRSTPLLLLSAVFLRLRTVRARLDACGAAQFVLVALAECENSRGNTGRNDVATTG